MARAGQSSSTRRRGVAVLRGTGFLLAAALGVAGIWLIVTSTTTPKRIEIGVLVGLWGLLIGTYSGFAGRPLSRPVNGIPESTEHAGAASSELEVPARGPFRDQLHSAMQQVVRDELHKQLGRELADLRAEVAQLRRELVETVGGHLRLERTETTRLIGADLLAVQDELRRLREGGGVDLVGTATVTVPSSPAPEAATVAPAGQPDDTGPASVQSLAGDDDESRGRRYRHSEDDDVLARILAREARAGNP